MASNDELDRMIDGALASYSGVEPLAGLEERVLNRVRVAETERPRLRLWRWILAGSVLAALLVVAIVLRTQRNPAPKTNEIARVEAHVPLAPAPAREAPRVAPTRLRMIAKAPQPERLPKLEQFPAPAPLTAEERALVAFVGRDPKQAQQVFSDLQKHSNEPIEVGAIQIPPLHQDGAE